ncbi:dihydrodipicolinate synthase family protein [Ktedonobacter sp. SOSP1-52]|uniref:dihydrodipicolinate synthase family protein n=1 Tax=Ktedonobacter sp. SOSP1-52 TaxID=2778366 RepID=UPI001915F80C|nr:dihydrodipicolinate synthase family protein [Ktedonobacter sp. SOSP1-52]GHO62020.1 dihydrodipicolinate synthase family protein [Ktedonobacter sp. SOSP1-52]
MIRGIICPLLTPKTDDGQIDISALNSLLEYVIAGGVDGLLIAGTTGECAALSDRAWSELVAHSTRKHAVTIVNVSHCSLHETLNRATYAAEQGAEYITATVPFYFPLQPAEAVDYYLRLADASPRPLMLYNIPQYTKTDIFPQLPRLVEHPNIVGIKDSAGLLDRLGKFALTVSDSFTVLSGTESHLEALQAMRISGLVPGLANLVPSVYRKWQQALETGDRESTRTCSQTIIALSALYSEVESSAPYIQVFRYGLRLLGIEIGDAFSPLQPLSEESKHRIERVMRDHHVI